MEEVGDAIGSYYSWPGKKAVKKFRDKGRSIFSNCEIRVGGNKKKI